MSNSSKQMMQCNETSAAKETMMLNLYLQLLRVLNESITSFRTSELGR